MKEGAALTLDGVGQAEDPRAAHPSDHLRHTPPCQTVTCSCMSCQFVPPGP
jgi:hypothetical protein